MDFLFAKSKKKTNKQTKNKIKTKQKNMHVRCIKNAPICTKSFKTCFFFKRGGHSNTTVVHMRDQWFSKHALKELYPFKEKHPKTRTVLHPTLPPKEDFLGTHFEELGLKSDP